MVNLYDIANELEKAIRESEEFNAVKSNYEKVNNDETSKVIFEDFRTIQMTLQEKQMTGQEITEEDIQSANELAEKIEKDENISNLMQAEQRMGQIIDDVNRIVMKPLQELYQVEGQ